MPATRRSMAPDAATPLKALRVLSDNVPTAPTPGKNTLTPGKKVVALKAELEKKDAENEALQKTIADLTSALMGLNVVQEKIDTDGPAAAPVAAAPVEDGAKAPRKKADKDAPVAAKTAYKFYCDSHPKPKAGVDMRQVWKEVGKEIRQPYEAMAKADKDRYTREMASYQEEKEALEMYYGQKRQDMAMEFMEAHLVAQATLEKVDAEKKKGKKKRATKDPEAPKRPLSSYMYFAKEMRETVVKKNPNASPTEVTKSLGEMWGQLEKGKGGKKGTKKYEDLAAVDKVRYEGEKKVYDEMVAERNKVAEAEKAERLSKDKEEALKLLRSRQDAATVAASAMANTAAVKTVKTVAVDEMSVVSELTNGNKPLKTKKKKDPNAPKKACSAYIFFTKENRTTIAQGMPTGAPQKEILTEVGRQWKELSEKDKVQYVKMAEEDKKRYAKEMEKYTPAESIALE